MKKPIPAELAQRFAALRFETLHGDRDVNPLLQSAGGRIVALLRATQVSSDGAVANAVELNLAQIDWLKRTDALEDALRDNGSGGALVAALANPPSRRLASVRAAVARIRRIERREGHIACYDVHLADAENQVKRHRQDCWIRLGMLALLAFGLAWSALCVINGGPWLALNWICLVINTHGAYRLFSPARPSVRSDARRLILPPGIHLRTVADLIYGEKARTRIFDPIIADMQEEHFQAVLQGRPWKAGWIHVRGVLAFLQAMGFKTVLEAARSVWKALS